MTVYHYEIILEEHHTNRKLISILSSKREVLTYQSNSDLSGARILLILPLKDKVDHDNDRSNLFPEKRSSIFS